MSDALILPDRVRCGMVLAGGSREQVASFAPAVEAAGFDSIWVGDHISFYIPVLESLTLLSFAAALTEKIELCTGVYLLPLRHPTIAAKVTSTLDVLSGGRLKLGEPLQRDLPSNKEPHWRLPRSMSTTTSRCVAVATRRPGYTP